MVSFKDKIIASFGKLFFSRLIVEQTNSIMAIISKTDAQKKVYELTEKLIFTKKDFRDIASGYKEKIKELENEIKAIVEEAESGGTSIKTP